MSATKFSSDSGCRLETAESFEMDDITEGVGDCVCIEDKEPIMGLEAVLTNPG